MQQLSRVLNNYTYILTFYSRYTLLIDIQYNIYNIK